MILPSAVFRLDKPIDFPRETRWQKTISPERGSALTTGGDLMFIGDSRGHFIAFHARGGISAPAITYMLDGKQQVAVLAGTSLYTFQLHGAEASGR